LKRLFVTCEYPPIIGGQGAYLKNLWSDLDKDENVLLVPSICRSPGNIHPAVHIAYMSVPAGERWLSRSARLVMVFLAMVRTCMTFRPQEIHAGQLVVGGACALLIRLLFNIPYSVYCYGADVLEFSRYPLARALVRAIFANSGRIITISAYTAGLIKDLYHPKTVISIVNPCIEDRFFDHRPAPNEALRRRHGLGGKKVLLTISRLVERKGHDVVIKSLPFLRKTVPDIHYLIVGDGPCRARLEALAAETGVAGLVSFCGSVSKGELPDYYCLGNVFVMVPRILDRKGDVEGFGIVYIEANALGLPVVASRCGGIVDAVEDNSNGLLVNDPTDAREVAAACEKVLLNDALHRTLSANARRWARKFSCESQRKIWREAVQW
jgi:phosphatidyl-myo-inositol dimannoside synthase